MGPAYEAIFFFRYAEWNIVEFFVSLQFILFNLVILPIRLEWFTFIVSCNLSYILRLKLFYFMCFVLQDFPTQIEFICIYPRCTYFSVQRLVAQSQHINSVAECGNVVVTFKCAINNLQRLTIITTKLHSMYSESQFF